MKRRNFISGLSVLSVAATLSPASSFAETTSKRKKALKIAWLSDTHVKPTDVAETGMRKAFHHVNNSPYAKK